MGKHTDLTKADILHIAKLANLSLTDIEVEKYIIQLTETIHYVENLDQLDTNDVEPTSHSTNVSNVFFEDGTKNERGFTQEEALQNAKNTKNGQFVVKRIMES
ncbi:MAG TPA: Asp-tRNA(Asn)/Glu-tRNA(Gln) amidotransferase subunit GatC [Candidatus Woesebacteria bacterium]|nr:Asp-tRNA(Asn)/Glu-tRNA(Gln) amidotransferase subunit GatC [Candidatus Woesebacteria bacterium]